MGLGLETLERSIDRRVDKNVSKKHMLFRGVGCVSGFSLPDLENLGFGRRVFVAGPFDEVLGSQFWAYLLHQCADGRPG